MPGRDRGDAQPARIQCAERDLQTLALGADATIGVDRGVVVERRRRRDGRQAHLLLGLAERQAGQIAGNQEARDPLGAFAGAREQRVEVRDPAMGDPRLRPVEHVATVGGLGRTPQRRRIGAGLRLGQAVRADPVARQHLGQPPLLLLLGSERQERVRRQAVHADRDRDRRPAGRDLLEHLQIDLVGLTAAAPFLGLGQAQQPCRSELGEHAVGIGLGALVFVDDRVEQLVDDVSGQGDELIGFGGGEQAVYGHGGAPSGKQY